MKKINAWSHVDLKQYTETVYMEECKRVIILANKLFPEQPVPPQLKKNLIISQQLSERVFWDFKKRDLSVVVQIERDGEEKKIITMSFKDLDETKEKLKPTGARVLWFPPNYASYEDFQKDLSERLEAKRIIFNGVVA